MIFSNSQDYLCYVEAVHLLYHENKKKNCDFLLDSNSFREQSSKFNKTREKFLMKDQRVKEYFFVLDNTEYPEALRDDSWTAPEVRPMDGTKDVNVELSFKLIYTSNDTYFAYTFIFIVTLAVLTAILLISIVVYLRMTFKYRGYARERKELK
jgi:hypothetical protein